MKAIPAAGETGSSQAGRVTELEQKEFLITEEVSELLTIKGFPTTTKYLGKLASVGGGPEYHKFAARRLYRPGKALEWARSRVSGPFANTSDADARLGGASA